MTKWPGSIIETDDDRARVLEAAGPEHIGTCQRCGREYFMRTPGKSPVCYGCWYNMELESYEDVYKDVFDSLKAMGLEPFIAQTGGMCMALQFALEEGAYAWLTDREDTLSFDRDPAQGWTVGVYFYDEESDGMPLRVFDGEDYKSADVKSTETAVELARAAVEKWAEHRS